MNTTTAVATSSMSEPRKLSPMDSFRKDAVAMEREFSRALPPHIPVERFLRVVTTAVQTSMAANFTNLLECDRKSLWQAAIRAAQDGLLPDGREGAILKYGDKAQWLPMVAGIRKKARNSGEISTWDVHCVFKNDEFKLRLGDNPSIEHTYDLSTARGELIGAYSVALLKDGSKSYEVMSIDEIRAIRDRSSAWQAYTSKKIKSTPWSTDEGEMARKTVAKRHAKQLPSSADLDDPGPLHAVAHDLKRKLAVNRVTWIGRHCDVAIGVVLVHAGIRAKRASLDDATEPNAWELLRLCRMYIFGRVCKQ